MRTENLTIAFVDIKGFTTLTSGQSRSENKALLKRFEDLVVPLAGLFDGQVIKSIGDAFLLTFRSPTDSLHCAMAIQDRLSELNLVLPPREHFLVRLAVNVGEVRVEDGDVFGEAVNIASRIESLADGGDVYFSEAVFLVMNKNEIPCEEVGTRQLKGIAQPVKVYRILRTPGSKQSYGGQALGKVRGRLASPLALGLIWARLRFRYGQSRDFRNAVRVAVVLALAAVLVAGWQSTNHPKPVPKKKNIIQKIFG